MFCVCVEILQVHAPFDQLNKKDTDMEKMLVSYDIISKIASETLLSSVSVCSNVMWFLFSFQV